MATNRKKQSRGKASKRRYFRRRREKDVVGIEQGGEEQPIQGTSGKAQNRKRTTNRRRSRRRNNRPDRISEKTVPYEEDTQPPTDVYIYTHVIRPAYKEAAGGDFYADHALDLSATSDTPQPDMDHLLESIGRQLDEWFANNR